MRVLRTTLCDNKQTRGSSTFSVHRDEEEEAMASASFALLPAATTSSKKSVRTRRRPLLVVGDLRPSPDTQHKWRQYNSNKNALPYLRNQEDCDSRDEGRRGSSAKVCSGDSIVTKETSTTLSVSETLSDISIATSSKSAPSSVLHSRLTRYHSLQQLQQPMRPKHIQQSHRSDGSIRYFRSPQVRDQSTLNAIQDLCGRSCEGKYGPGLSRVHDIPPRERPMLRKELFRPPPAPVPLNVHTRTKTSKREETKPLNVHTRTKTSTREELKPVISRSFSDLSISRSSTASGSWIAKFDFEDLDQENSTKVEKKDHDENCAVHALNPWTQKFDFGISREQQEVYSRQHDIAEEGPGGFKATDANYQDTRGRNTTECDQRGMRDTHRKHHGFSGVKSASTMSPDEHLKCICIRHFGNQEMQRSQDGQSGRKLNTNTTSYVFDPFEQQDPSDQHHIPADKKPKKVKEIYHNSEQQDIHRWHHDLKENKPVTVCDQFAQQHISLSRHDLEYKKPHASSDVAIDNQSGLQNGHRRHHDPNSKKPNAIKSASLHDRFEPQDMRHAHPHHPKKQPKASTATELCTPFENQDMRCTRRGFPDQKPKVSVATDVLNPFEQLGIRRRHQNLPDEKLNTALSDVGTDDKVGTQSGHRWHSKPTGEKPNAMILPGLQDQFDQQDMRTCGFLENKSTETDAYDPFEPLDVHRSHHDLPEKQPNADSVGDMYDPSEQEDTHRKHDDLPVTKPNASNTSILRDGPWDEVQTPFQQNEIVMQMPKRNEKFSMDSSNHTSSNNDDTTTTGGSNTDYDDSITNNDGEEDETDHYDHSYSTYDEEDSTSDDTGSENNGWTSFLTIDNEPAGSNSIFLDFRLEMLKKQKQKGLLPPPPPSYCGMMRRSSA